VHFIDARATSPHNAPAQIAKPRRKEMLLVTVVLLLLVCCMGGKPPVDGLQPVSSPDEVVNMPGTYLVICAVTANEDQYVEEWVRYHHHIGFNMIHLIDNNMNQSAALAKLSLKYPEKLRVRRYAGEINHPQAYFKCAKPYSAFNAWVAFIDVDEFIVLRKHSSVKSMLWDLVPHGGALSINRVLFGSNGRRVASPEPVVQRFTARSKRMDTYVKTITYMPHTLRVMPHFTVLREPHERLDTEGNPLGKTSAFSRNPSEDTAAIYHYHLKSAEEFRRKELLDGRKYTAAALSGVGAPLEEEMRILKEFRQLNENANVLQDKRALDVYREIKDATN
jgi:hypothetical protein